MLANDLELIVIIVIQRFQRCTTFVVASRSVAPDFALDNTTKVVPRAQRLVALLSRIIFFSKFVHNLSKKNMLSQISKVLITDDHSLIRAGIAHLVSRLLPEAQIVHAETRLATLQALSAHADIGLLVVDLTLADAHGLGIVESVFAHHPLLPVVVVSGVEDADLARRAVALGVLGFVAKSADSAATEAALQTVLNGGRYLPSFAYAASQQKPFSPSSLSERQTEVMRLMCEGLSNKQIAAALNLTEATVKGHLTLVFRALKVSSRSQAIVAAQTLS